MNSQTDLEKIFQNGKNKLVLAHRGSLNINHYPENSIPAFEEAVQLGADGFELDVRLSRDNVLMIFHDEKMTRLLGNSDRISDLNYEEIRDHKFLDTPGNMDIRIPSLRELFEKFGSSVYYNIEVKRRFTSYKTVVQRLKELIQKFDLENNVWVSSFDPVFLYRWHRTFPIVRTAFLFENWNSFIRYICARDFIRVLHPSVELMPHLPSILSFKKPLFFWTVNGEKELSLLREYDIRGVITDNVTLCKRFMNHENK